MAEKGVSGIRSTICSDANSNVKREMIIFGHRAFFHAMDRPQWRSSRRNERSTSMNQDLVRLFRDTGSTTAF